MKQHEHKVKQPYTFTGREWDGEIELYYYRARYYDPKVGRFISFDPILHPTNTSPKCGQIKNIPIPSFKLILVRPQALNPFVYITNNTINIIDPFGLYGTTDCSYYQKRCDESGGFYYCYIVQVVCENWPDWTAPDWAKCVRQCLQEYDEKYCKSPCKSADLSCVASAHSYCFRKCASNPNEQPSFPSTPPW